jgi:hypothetical protein
MNRIVTILALSILLVSCRTNSTRQDPEASLNQVIRIKDAIVQYRRDHDNKYPSDLQSLLPDYLSGEKDLWIPRRNASHPSGEFLVYVPGGLEFGGSKVIAFTSSTMSDGNRYVINDDNANSVWSWGEAAFQAWLSGDPDF